MSDYSYQDLMKMQNEAVRRVEEMQKKAQAASGAGEKSTFPEPPPALREAPKKPSEPRRIPMPDDYLKELKRFAANSSYNPGAGEAPKPDSPKRPQHADKPEEMLKNLLSDLGTDSDKTLILSLVLLLSDDHADELLILALLYILQ